MPSPIDPSNPLQPVADLDVRGAVPLGLSGRLVGVDRDCVVHSVLVRDGRVSYSGRRFRTEAAVHSLVAYGGSTLVFGHDSPAFELPPEADALRRVDLAGQGRSVAVDPKQDPATGELHLVANDSAGDQAYVVVSAGALTRHSRPFLDTPHRIRHLALSRDHAVLVADGYVGVAPREGELRTTWIATGIADARPVHAHDAGDVVVVLALTPVLERWTLHPEARCIQREVLDPTPRRFARCGNDAAGATPRCLWTTGNGTVGHHELARARHVHCNLRPGAPGDLAFVTDTTRRSEADGGWLVGFVHDASSSGCELLVIDAADIAGPGLATAPISRLVPRGLRCTWIPETPR
jgi:carotenoid cleavage dioxygenase-like enzyme